MTKYIVAGAVLVVGLLIAGSALAGDFGDKYPRASVFSIIPGKVETPVYKFVDGNASCYVVNSKTQFAISCVK